MVLGLQHYVLVAFCVEFGDGEAPKPKIEAVKSSSGFSSAARGLTKKAVESVK